jgi:hypothetical protein
MAVGETKENNAVKTLVNHKIVREKLNHLIFGNFTAKLQRLPEEKALPFERVGDLAGQGER